MRYDSLSTFIQKNLAVLQLTFTLIGVLTSLFVAYVSYRIAPLATHIQQVEAAQQVTASSLKDEQGTYIPLVLQNQEDIKNLNDHVVRIDSTTQRIYQLLIEEKQGK